MYGTGVGTTASPVNPGCCCSRTATSKDWTIDYDPPHTKPGAIAVTLGGVSRTLVLYPGEKAEGAVLDRFGLFNMQDNNGKAFGCLPGQPLLHVGKT